MLKKFLVTASVLAMVASASAAITASHAIWSQGTLPAAGNDYVSWRITIDVDPGSEFTASDLATTSDLTGGIFYHDAMNDTNPPNHAFFGMVPDSEFTSYYTTPGDYPNTTALTNTGFAAGPVDTTTSLSASWFDSIVAGDGTFVMCQITVVDPAPDYSASFMFRYADALTGGTLFEYPFTIPEPASLSLLALGGLALIRRR